MNLLALVAVLAASPTTKDSAAFPQASSAIPITPTDPQLGSRDAPLTLVVFSDRLRTIRAFLAATEKLRARYGNKVRIVCKDVSVNAGIHPEAITESASARGVYALGGWAAYEKFLELVVTHEGRMDQDTLTGLAVVSGVKDRKAFEEGVLTQQWLKDVRASERVAKDLDGQMPGPTWFVNGLKQIGFTRDFEPLYPVFDKELEAASAALKQGFKPIDVYGYRVKANLDKELTPSNEALQKRLEVTTDSIGPLKLGMSMDEVKKLMRVKEWPRNAACATLKKNDDCEFILLYDANGLEQIQYNLEAGDGFTFEGKFVTGSANAETVKRILGCGPTEPGEGGSSTKCPGKLVVMEGGMRCLKTFADSPDTGCWDAAGGRNRSKMPPPVELRLVR